MRLVVWSAFLCFLLAWPAAHASEVVDRKPLVEVAYRMFPGLLRNAISLKEFNQQLTDDEKAIIKRMKKYGKAHMSRLIYVPNTNNQFVEKEGEAPRLMRTPPEITADEKIFVNETLLQDPNLEIDFLFLQKLFFHEISHKTGDISQGLKDRIAQQFENHIRLYSKPARKIANGVELLIFSIPAEKLDVEFEKVSDIEIQPSVMLMLKRGNTYYNLMPQLNEAIKRPILTMRSMGAEINKAIFPVMGIMGSAIEAMMQIMAEQVGALVPLLQSFGINTNGLSKEAILGQTQSLLVAETRSIDIHDVEAVQFPGMTYLSMKTTFAVSRTNKNLEIGFNGSPSTEGGEKEIDFMNWKDSFPVSIHIQAEVPSGANADLSQTKFHIQIRPTIDFTKTAKVGRTIRTNGSVTSMEVAVPADKTPTNMQMVVNYGSGSLLLQARGGDLIADRLYKIHFEFDSSIYGNPAALVADSVLVDGEKTIYLDQLVNLSSPEKTMYHTPNSNKESIIPNSLGFWSNKDGKAHFAVDFGSGSPILLAQHASNQTLSLPAVHPDQMVMDFKLKSLQKIKQIRLHQKRMVILIVPDKEREGNYVKRMKKDEWQEILAADVAQIQAAQISSDTQMVRVLFQPKFKVREHPGEKYKESLVFPTLNPIMVEVVLEDLQTLRYYFNSSVSKACEWALDPEASQRTATDQ